MIVSGIEQGEIETVSGSDFGAHAMAGVRRALGRFAVGAEAVYSTIPNALDGRGAAAQTGENDLGGLALLATFGWRF